ncbi:uncharacterized protein LOC126992111 isoform X8 [Eriocheir sinensis]|uniref:uncharacterized protein LOC126992111 isoform X8 n=1 Tax=Eriocheir sinensis TaxID=95602 RepID=UPI0021C6F42E|nr:uncharacterized protein LOC126992111 isoform X8 [Eriocheir sinensis]
MGGEEPHEEVEGEILMADFPQLWQLHWAWSPIEAHNYMNYLILCKKGFFRRERLEEMKAHRAMLQRAPTGVSNPAAIGEQSHSRQPPVFMVQKNGQTTTRVIKLPLETPRTPTKTVSDVSVFRPGVLRPWPATAPSSCLSPHLIPTFLHHRFSGREIPKSPFRVNVSGYAGDPSKVTASGPNLEPEGVMINRPTYFDIFTKGKWLETGGGTGAAPSKTEWRGVHDVQGFGVTDTYRVMLIRRW